MAIILIIEDNEPIRENMAELLEMEGFEVMIAANGKEGIDQAASGQPDIVLCDIHMP